MRCGRGLQFSPLSGTFAGGAGICFGALLLGLFPGFLMTAGGRLLALLPGDGGGASVSRFCQQNEEPERQSPKAAPKPSGSMDSQPARSVLVFGWSRSE
jgi:hypothetical protein